MHKLIISYLGFALLATVCSTRAENLNNTQLEELHQRIDALKKELNGNQAAHQDATDALQESEIAISDANKKLFEITQMQQAKRSALNQLKSKSGIINDKIAQQQDLLSKQMYAQYLQGQPSYAKIILQNNDPNAAIRDLQYFSYIAKARTHLVSDMQSNLHQIAKLNEETSKTLSDADELKKQQVLERQQLQAKKQEKAKVVQSLNSKINSQRVEIKKLTRDEQRLSQLVERLAKIVPKAVPAKVIVNQKTPLQHTLQQAQPLNKSIKDTQVGAKANKATTHEPENETDSNSTNPERGPTTVATNDTLPSSTESNVDFSRLRGKLHLPVRGEVSNRFGAIREDSGLSWKGLFIRSAEGSDVKSIASGRVVFSDWLRGFGNLIILDHGNGYMSLYGNNQAVLKKVGEVVNAGETIAIVGNSGGNESNGLYYELRKQSRPFDPMSWSSR